MVGRPMRKVFCQGFTRAGRREGKLIPCRMKGYELANGTYYCKYHGYQNVKGFRKKNYTHETRIKQLSKLQQFRNYTDDQLKEYYYNKVNEFSLMKFYHFLKKNPEMNERITEARKNGVQTLIDKLLQVFQYQEIENPNQILWIREKTKFITFLANKLTDLYSDNKVQNVKTDQSIKISWEDNQNDMIDVSEDIVDIPSDNKD